MKKNWDVIVLGTGGVGSASLMHLARRGVQVLGLDQHPPAHAFGSSHGETRIIRKAYFEHPNYVPLLLRSYELWDDLGAASGRDDLFVRTGLLQVGPADGVVVPGVMSAAAKHSLDLESVSKCPPYRIPEHCTAVLERDAGFLRVEDCVLEHLNLAQRAGAELMTGVVVQDWRAHAEGVVVSTSAGDFEADKLVITAGAWAPKLLSSLGVPMHIRRKALFWMAARMQSTAHLVSEGCPCFFYENAEGQFYGFPEITPGGGIKLACHSGGDVVDGPESLDRSLKSSDLTEIQSFVSQWLPEVSGEMLRHAVCMYTMSPDENFIIDKHPEHQQVVFAAGLSGHGFKFASVIGEIMADLALEGHTAHPAGFLGLSRFR
ncbi:MAG: N-methyl-L-tryptophan oxidase [Verrucomicrobiaceae bacterium]|nr:N-methyl-L-tryptophan oxidase [Verrucomicrobiaceae bacterium]